MGGLASAALVWWLAACSAGEEPRSRPSNTGSGGAAEGGSSAARGGASNAQGGTSGGFSASGGAAQAGSGLGGASGGALGSGGATGSGGAAQAGGAAQGGANAGGRVGAGGAGSGGASNAGASSSGGASSGGVGGKASAGSAGASASGGVGGGGATCAGFVLCDDFEDGNFNANPAWIATPSAFSLTSDGTQVLTQKATTEAWAYAGVGTWTDVTIQARVKVVNFAGTSSTNCASLIARWQGSSNPNYQASLCANGSVGIYKDGDLVNEDNGTKSLGIVANTWYTLKFKVSGAPGNVALSLSVNDMPALTLTDTDSSTPVAAGYVGLGSKKTLTIEYDDIKVSTP
ncbi:MAG: hypothetical protein ACOY0T_17975 [Myxococcota bacterium]